MDEVKKVISYIRSCREAGIDATITIDKSRSHLILNALEKQVAKKTLTKTFDKDVRVGCTTFEAGTSVHYCPGCHLAVPGSQKFCGNCGQALIR